MCLIISKLLPYHYHKSVIFMSMHQKLFVGRTLWEAHGVPPDSLAGFGSWSPGQGREGKGREGKGGRGGERDKAAYWHFFFPIPALGRAI